MIRRFLRRRPKVIHLIGEAEIRMLLQWQSEGLKGNHDRGLQFAQYVDIIFYCTSVLMNDTALYALYSEELYTKQDNVLTSTNTWYHRVILSYLQHQNQQPDFNSRHHCCDTEYYPSCSEKWFSEYTLALLPFRLYHQTAALIRRIRPQILIFQIISKIVLRVSCAKKREYV